MSINNRRITCNECGSTTFQRDYLGFYTCKDCGTQRAEVHQRQEYDAHQVGGGPSGRRRLVRASGKNINVAQIDKEIKLSLILLEAYQWLLKDQCRFMCQTYQCQSTLFGLVGRMFAGWIQWWKQNGWGKTRRN